MKAQKVSEIKDKTVVEIQVNGEKHQFEQGVTITDLLDKFGINQKNCLVEVNLETLPIGEYSRILVEKDQVELVRFIGGG